MGKVIAVVCTVILIIVAMILYGYAYQALLIFIGYVLGMAVFSISNKVGRSRRRDHTGGTWRH